MPAVDDAMIEKIRRDLNESGFPDVLACDDTASSDVVVWGTGAQSSLVISKANYFSKNQIKYFIDPSEQRIGKTFHDKKIFDPSTLKNKDLPIFIAAVQSSPLIYTQYLKLNLPQKNIIKKLVI